MLNTGIRVYAPVTEKRPVAADFFNAVKIDLSQDERFVFGGLCHDDAERIANKRVAPELDPGTLPIELLQADTVHRGDPAAVRDRMAALNRLPRIELLLAVLLLLGWVPTDGGRIEQDVCTLQGREARAFGIPLVPAHQRANRADLRVEGAKTQIAGGEVELLVIRGIVGDVHLAIDALHLPVGVDDRGRVVI